MNVSVTTLDDRGIVYTDEVVMPQDERETEELNDESNSDVIITTDAQTKSTSAAHM